MHQLQDVVVEDAAEAVVDEQVVHSLFVAVLDSMLDNFLPPSLSQDPTLEELNCKHLTEEHLLKEKAQYS